MSEDVQGIVKQSAFLADRHRLDTVTAKPTANYTIAGVCAIIALLVYGLLVTLQVMDFRAYQFQ
jgi:hypothetical protein